MASLDSQLSDSDKESIRENDGTSLVRFHHSLGTWLRNTWRLWDKNELSDSLVSEGITHPDDISMLIITAYWYHLNRVDFDIDEYRSEQARKRQERLKRLREKNDA